MPALCRLFLYSAITATVFCLFTYYRKRRRNTDFREIRAIVDILTGQSPGYSRIGEIKFHLPEIQIDSFEECLFSDFHKSSAVAKVSLCVSGCAQALVKPIKEPTIPTTYIPTQMAVPSQISSPESTDSGGFVDQEVSLSDSPVGSSSDSDRLLTPDSNDLSSSPEAPPCVLPPDGFSDPKNDIYEATPEEMNGQKLPTVLIPSDMWAKVVDKDMWHETFCIPAHMGGVLIGRLGKNVRELRNVWQAEFSLNTCPGKQDTLLFNLCCPLKYKKDVMQWVSQRFRMRPSRTTIGNPNQLKRCLPLGEATPVHIRSLYGSKELFVTIQDNEYSKYLEMQAELDEDYKSINSFRMQLCEPVTSGTVAIVPHSQGFSRALIISVFPTWPKSVFYFLLDHGTFGIVTLNKLRKIRAKYMRVPFQAIHVSWAHAYPVFSDIPDLHILRTFFNSGNVHAFPVRMETCCRASVAFVEPYPQPYSPQNYLDVLVSACNSGLYMAVPLALYPSRQCWLNGTNVPYYPFNRGAIDYTALVSFVQEEQSLNHDGIHPTELHNSEDQNGNNRSNAVSQNRSGTLNFGRSRSNMNNFSRNRGPRSSNGAGGIWYHTAPSQRSRQQNSEQNPQKENQFVPQTSRENNVTQLKSQTDSKLANAETQNVSQQQQQSQQQPNRRPLGSRNIRSSGMNGSNNVRTHGTGRGRGFSFQNRT